jgi:[citrate (pro-3S)-lyase] ligase
VDWTAGVFDDNGRLVATGSLKEDMIQGVAVEPTRQGEDLLARVLTELIGEAGRRGKSSLYLFTKPEAAIQFQGLGLRTVAVVRPYVALMEWGEAGIDSYVAKLKTIRRQAEKGSCSLTCAAIVMNANPFTKGHRYLVEQAAAGADLVYVLVVEENKSMFSFQDRLEMVRRGTADLPNVTVIGGGRYAVSALTFPSYFTGEEKVAYAQTAMDAELFAKYIGPALGVSLRFVGSEPLSHVTEIYNQALLSRLPKAGIEVRRLQRLEDGGVPISASRVRKILQKAGFQPDHTDLRRLLPETTLSYINEMNLRGIKPWEKG